MSRLRPYWIVGILVVAVGMCAAIFGANQPAFHLATLTVEGLARVSRSDVVERAAIDPAANIWFLNTRAIEKRIETLPYVRTAGVHRRPLAAMSIAIVERMPNACAHDGAGRSVTIDRDARVLQNDCSDPSLVSYALHDAIRERAGAYLHARELELLEADAANLAESAQHFISFSHDRFGQLVATTPGGIAIEFGDEGDLGRKERLIGPILAQVGSRASEVKSVDLRAPATPVVEFRAPVIRRSPQPVDTQ